jgi:hypothetical protein
MTVVEGVEVIDPSPELAYQLVELDQIVYALRRAADDMNRRNQRLVDAGDYSAEFLAEDARLLEEAIALLTAKPIARDYPQKTS